MQLVNHIEEKKDHFVGGVVIRKCAEVCSLSKSINHHKNSGVTPRRWKSGDKF